MSSPLAVAAVTAALKDLLNDGLLNHDLSTVGSFSVTASPPDRITTGQNEPNQLNLFLYQVTANLGWRNSSLPSRDSRGTRITNQPLALDLHYLLTAYGSEDLNAEVLLGYAMHLLHEQPVLTRDQLRAVLGGVPLVDGTILPGPFGALSALDLADQVESIRISPVYLTTDELSKMWTAMQSRYRPSMAYNVSVVLIQGTKPVQTAPPVLKRGPNDRGPVAVGAPFPALTSVRPAISDLLPAMRLGDDLLVSGNNLQSPGAMTVVLRNDRAGSVRELAPTAVSNGLMVHVPTPVEDPNTRDEWAIGVYSASLRITATDAPEWTTNEVPVAMSPSISVSPLNAAPGTVNLTIACSPRLRPAQEKNVLLIFGSTTVQPDTVVTPADPLQPTTLTFTVNGVLAGAYVIRLRVDGVDSIPVTITGSKLDFDPQQRVTVA